MQIEINKGDKIAVDGDFFLVENINERPGDKVQLYVTQSYGSDEYRPKSHTITGHKR